MRRPKGAVSDELVPVYECVPSGTPLRRAHGLIMAYSPQESPPINIHILNGEKGYT